MSDWSRFLLLVALVALATDFCYTWRRWLFGARSHRWYRYLVIVALLAAEGAGAVLITSWLATSWWTSWPA